jgi:hypothetical protein
VVQFLPAAHDAQDDACGCGWTGERSLERGTFAEGILERVMNTIPKHWLRRCATPAEFEREQLERTAAAWSLPIEKVVQKFEQRPFRSGTTERWRAFVQQLGDGDELWLFSSPDDMFAKKLGCMGYAIVRDGEIRDTLVLLRT